MIRLFLDVFFLFAAFVEIIFQQPTFDFPVVKGHPALRAQAHFLDHFQISGEEVSMVAAADAFQPIAAAFIKRFQSLQCIGRSFFVDKIGSLAEDDFLPRRDFLFSLGSRRLDL